MAQAEQPTTKRMRLAYHHKHKPDYRPQQLPPHEPSVLPAQSIDQLFIDSIKLICEEVAAEQSIEEPYIESVALEALHDAAEEFTLRFCSKIRQPMFAARRTTPIATDFDSAIQTLNIPRPDDQIPRYKTNPTTNPPLLPTPPPEGTFHNQAELPAPFLGPDLSKQGDLQQLTFAPGLLPPLPSAHTYKNTAVYTPHETDSRRIRELATEEGKLGEQALRKLAGAVKLETAISTEPEARLMRSRRGRRRGRPALTEEAMFEETMRDLLQNESGDFELGPIVTSEKQYRMPDEARAKRKVTAPKTDDIESLKNTVPSRYNILPPPLRKQ